MALILLLTSGKVSNLIKKKKLKNQSQNKAGIIKWLIGECEKCNVLQLFYLNWRFIGKKLKSVNQNKN